MLQNPFSIATYSFRIGHLDRHFPFGGHHEPIADQGLVSVQRIVQRETGPCGQNSSRKIKMDLTYTDFDHTAHINALRTRDAGILHYSEPRETTRVYMNLP